VAEIMVIGSIDELKLFIDPGDESPFKLCSSLGLDEATGVEIGSRVYNLAKNLACW
jgi:hypothetical protein